MEPSIQKTGMAESLPDKFQRVLGQMASARPFARQTYINQLLEICRRLLMSPEGVQVLYENIGKLDQVGIFSQTDWENPLVLQSSITPKTFSSRSRHALILECLSELRWLALAREDYSLQNISAYHAQKYIREVLALNLEIVFKHSTEATRQRGMSIIYNLFDFLVSEIGYGDILEEVISEIWRILKQRPILNQRIITMITQLSICLKYPDVHTPRGAERLISALYGPTEMTQSDPGLEYYCEKLEILDLPTLQKEAGSFARAMHDTGLVSAYHAGYLNHVLAQNNAELVMLCLGLSTTARDVYKTYQELIERLISEAITAHTAQSIYGLACMLERGILYDPSLAPNLWRLVLNELHPETKKIIRSAYGDTEPARRMLLSGVIQVLGLPFGIGQGENPTCQSARAISMWSYSDPNYLMQLITWVARDQEISMHFEGMKICSRDLHHELSNSFHTDLDPVSLLLVPHLDRIYHEMGRLCLGRQEDPHKWINPEFHGWWVNRGFAIAVDINSGILLNHEQFIRDFFAVYHPYYNGNKPVIAPQPAGIAITDSSGRFIGWHAITIIRVNLDLEGTMRVYFYNPNNDSGQDWGNGIKVSTDGHGEHYGQSSLPIEEFTSRLYIFHYDPLEKGDSNLVSQREVELVAKLAKESWAKDR